MSADNGIARRHHARGARRAPAGLRPALRHGDRRQLVAPHRRRRRRAADGRGEGAGARATRRSPSSARYAVAAVDPGGQLLMGPASRCPRRWSARASSSRDIDLFEMHEAFAAQVLSNIQASSRRTWAERSSAAPAGGRGRPRPPQRDGRLDRHRPPLRRHRRPAHHHARQRADAAGRAVRPDLRLRAGRHGLRDGAGAHERALTASRRQDGIAWCVTLDLPGEKVNTLDRARCARGVRGLCSTEVERDPIDQGRRARLRQARQLHRRRRHRGVPAPRSRARGGGAELAAAQALLDRLETLPRAGGRGDPRQPASAAASSSRSPATTASPPMTRRPQLGLPEVQLGLIPGAGGAHGCRGSSACGQRST